MKRALLSALAVAGIAFAAARADAITKEEVMTLARLGIPEAEILKAIEKDRTVFTLKIQDILELKKAGVPDAVIKFMLSTPERFGGGGAAPTAAPAATPATPTPAPAATEVREKTPEELQAEEERRREEARRLAEEQKRAEEARKQAYARGVMKQGLALAEDGKWVQAIQLFQEFLAREGFGPGSDEFYSARYGIAAALANAKMYQSAAKMLVEVLLEGPDRPFFKEAFGKLRELRRQVIYNPPDLEQLARFHYGAFSQAFQDEVNYVLGEFFYDYGNYQRALKHFEAVTADSPDRARALYLTGLVQVRHKMYKSALESFQAAIESAERTGTGRAVTDLAYMALARIAYEAENHDAAIFYYKKVPRESIRAPQVFYEMAWTYLMKGDYSRALGAFHALHSPYFERTFYPETWILEARVYSDLCRYDQAKRALERFDREVAVFMEPLKRFIAAQKSPDDFHVHFVESINGGRVEPSLPMKLAWPILSNVEFYNVYRTIRQIEREQAEWERNQDRLGSLGAEMLVKLAVLRKDRVFESGVKIQQVLKELDVTMGDAQVRETEIEVDINSAAMDRMAEEARRLAGEVAEAEEAGPEKVRGGSQAIVGGDTAVWPYQGEYWLDEIPFYRSQLTSQCLE